MKNIITLKVTITIKTKYIAKIEKLRNVVIVLLGVFFIFNN